MWIWKKKITSPCIFSNTTYLNSLYKLSCANYQLPYGSDNKIYDMLDTRCIASVRGKLFLHPRNFTEEKLRHT